MEQTHKSQAIQPWQGVDGIVVINMDSNPERYAQFMSETGQYLPADKLERLSAVAGRELSSYGMPPWFTERTGERARFWGGTGGCALSHCKAIKYAQEKGWRNILIFEDDCVLEQPDKAGVAVAEALLQTQGRYMLYLGYNKPAPYGHKFATLSNGIELWKTEGVLATHAYLIPESMYAPLLELMPESESDIWRWLSIYRAVDVFYRDFIPMKTGADIYVMHPMVATQCSGVSDIGGALHDAESMICRKGPRPCYGLTRLLRTLTLPFRNMKILLNSVRTQRRAAKGGLPGYKKRRK